MGESMSTSLPSLIGIEVVYAEAQRGLVRAYQVERSSTVADILHLAAADPAFAGIDLEHAAIGIFGLRVDGQQLLNDQDRVEIYRPLAADPKVARRARVRQERRRSKG